MYCGAFVSSTQNATSHQIWSSGSVSSSLENSRQVDNVSDPFFYRIWPIYLSVHSYSSYPWFQEKCKKKRTFLKNDHNFASFWS